MTYPTLPDYVWPDGRRSACCISVDVDAEAPWLWAHRAGLPATLGELEQRRYGPRQGLWRVAELLDRLGLSGSFYVPTAVATLHPEILPTLVEHGHEVGLHGHLHERVDEVSDAGFDAALGRSLEVFKNQVGIDSPGFRSPAWEMTSHMLASVRSAGCAYDSSLMGFDHPYEIDGLVEVPVQWAIDDAIFFKFAGGGVDRWAPHVPAGVGASWAQEHERGHELGSLLMVTVHPWISGRPRLLDMLEAVLAPIAARDDVWCATAAEIANHHRTSVNAGRFVASSSIDAERAVLDAAPRGVVR